MPIANHWDWMTTSRNMLTSVGSSHFGGVETGGFGSEIQYNLDRRGGQKARASVPHTVFLPHMDKRDESRLYFVLP